MESLVNSHKYIFVSPSLIDDLLVQTFEDGSYIIKSDITVMKELSGNPEKFTPAQVEAINARSAMRPPSYSGNVSDDEIISNIVPRDVQTLNERKLVSDYVTNDLLSTDKSEREKREFEELRNKILNNT